MTAREWLFERLERGLGSPLPAELLERACLRWEGERWHRGFGQRPGRKLAVLMRYLAGSSRQEIAAMLGCSLPTVQFILYRALRDLGACVLAERHADPWSTPGEKE